MAHTVVSNGCTLGEGVRPLIAEAYASGQMPRFDRLALPEAPIDAEVVSR